MSRIVDTLKQPRVWIPLVALLIAAVGAGVAGLVYGNWLVALILGLLGSLFVLVIVLLRTVVSQEREERLDRGYEETTPDVRRPRGGGLKAAFRESLSELRASRLGRDSLYALPWFLVVGERGAGKSAAIQASGLELPAEFAHVAHGGPTLDCDWWFTNQAVLLDTAGRYADSDDDGDRREWRTLLRLLRKARPKGAINGLVVAVPAHRLIGRSPAELEDEARALRRRINEITDSLSIDPPVYILVTKADQIEGFVEVVSTLPGARHHEALGWTNTERRFADAGDTASRGLAGMRDRIEQILPELVIREGDRTRQRRLLSFPQELEALSENLAFFLRSAFAASVYEETPFLRGVYLTSAQRSGTASSAVLARLGQDWARSEHAATTGSVFLRDLFRDVIVGDRDLALPISTLGPRARRAIFVTGVLMVAAAVAALGVATYQIQLHQRQVADRADRVNDAPSELALVDQLRQTIEAGEKVTVINRLGLGYTLDRALARGRDVFLRAFGAEFEEPAKVKLSGDVRQLDPSAFEALAELALDISWLRGRADLGPEYRPRMVRYAPRIGRNEEDQAAFIECYDAFVRWAPAAEIEERVETEGRTLAGASSQVLSLRYLQRWADSNEDARPPVRYTALGLPKPAESVRDSVSSAFTRTTWETVVRGLLSGVQEAKSSSEKSILEFERSYVNNYDTAWKRFILNASLEPVSDPAVKDSPYLGFLKRVRDEMKADLPRGSARQPEWVDTLEEALRDYPLEEPAAEGEEDAEGEGDEEKEAGPPWDLYLAALEGVAKDVDGALGSPEDALTLAVEAATTDATSFHVAVAQIQDILPRGGDAAVTRKLRSILEMPVINGLLAVLDSAMPPLDQTWRQEIAGPYTGRLDEAQLVELYGRNGGALQQFENTWLSNFLASGEPKPILRGLTMPFGPRFLAWVASAGKVQRALAGDASGAPEITLRFEGLPASVHSGGVLVKKRVLRVDCADRLLSLDYRPSRSHTLNWSPDCTEVELRISVLEGGIERELPSRSWRGPLAVPNFFQSAKRAGDKFVWTVRDPDGGIEISIPYRLKSGRNILDVAHHEPPGSMRN